MISHSAVCLCAVTMPSCKKKNTQFPPVLSDSTHILMGISPEKKTKVKQTNRCDNICMSQHVASPTCFGGNLSNYSMARWKVH